MKKCSHFQLYSDVLYQDSFHFLWHCSVAKPPSLLVSVLRASKHLGIMQGW